MSDNRDYSADIDKIKMGIGARALASLLDIMPCGHTRRYQLGNECTVCELEKATRQLQIVLDRSLGNYDLD